MDSTSLSRVDASLGSGSVCGPRVRTVRRGHLPSALRALSSASFAFLAACGGGGDGDASPPPLPATAQALTLTGTAAVGAAIAGRPVSVKCAAGTGSGVTAADGSYTVTIASGAWPCVAQLTSSSGTVLTTAATAAGTSAVANITPATHLVLATLLGIDPGAYFLSFDGTKAAAITAAALATAQGSLIQRMLAAGVDFSGLGDLFAAAFNAAYDTALDRLAARLVASGTTLSALTTSITVASAPSAVSTPADLLLQPAAANCAGLKSTTYRVLTPSNGATVGAQTSLLTVDATTLAVSHGGVAAATWIANGACRYSEQSGTYSADITVSQAGVLTARYTTDGITFRAYLGFPEQSHAASELAGTWNVMGMTRVSTSSYVGVAGTLTYDGSGRLVGGTNCQNNQTWAIDVCATLPASAFAGIVPLSVDSAGGFDIVDPNTLAVAGRLFAYRPGSGDLMLANVSNKGELFVSAAIKAVPLPVAGAATSSWNLDNNAAFVSTSPIYVTTNLVTSVDSATGSYVRSHTFGGGTATHPETLVANNPRTGFVHRASVTVADSNGTLVTPSEFTSLYVPGTGLAPLLLTTNTRLFELSARLP